MRSVRYAKEEVGEEQRGCGRAGEEVCPWLGGQKTRRGYHVPCREEEGAGLLVHLLWKMPETAEQELEELLPGRDSLGQGPEPCYPGRG